jgi:hypothetical protein
MKKLLRLNKENQAHIKKVLRFVRGKLPPKYARGVSEHGGGLWKKNVGPEIEGELLDLIVYVYTREQQVKALVSAVQAYLDRSVPLEGGSNYIRAALAPFLDKTKK